VRVPPLVRCNEQVLEPFAHDATLAMEVDADLRAPGGAVTVALCGHWEHEPPCPLARHHTQAERWGDRVVLRILFAAEPGRVPDVRSRIDSALAAGQLRGPDGATSRWRLVGSAPSDVRADEKEHARRLRGA
jgi:hypothetical protein